MRKGLTVGSGRKGYYNVQCNDPRVHSQSAHGIKQPQRLPYMGGKNTKGNFHFSGRYTLREINGAWYIYDREKNTTIDRLNAHTFTKAEVEFSNWKKGVQLGGEMDNSETIEQEGGKIYFSEKGIKKPFTLSYENAIYVPSKDKDGKEISKTELEKRKIQTQRFLGRLYGGFSRFDDMGGYKIEKGKNKGKVTEEHGARVVSFASKEDMNDKYKNYKLKRFLIRKQKEWNQETMGYENQGELHYISKKENQK